MDTSWLPGWASGVSQKLAADLLKGVAFLLGAPVLAWAKSKGWRLVSPLAYGLVTWVYLNYLWYGSFTQGVGTLDWWVSLSVLVGSLALLVYVESRRDKQQQPVPPSDSSQHLTRWIEFYDSRSEKNAVRGDLEKELENSSEVWFAAVAGSQISRLAEHDVFRKFTRVVINDPQSVHARKIASLQPTYGGSFPDVALGAIKACQEHGKGKMIRLSDDFVLNVIISDPHESSAWARVQILLPYHEGEDCPGFRVCKKDRPALFDKIKKSFEQTWEAGKVPSSSEFIQEGNQTAEQERFSSAVAVLIKHREWAVHNLLNMPVQSAPDLVRWIGQRDWWRKQVVEDLRKVCSDAEVSRFDVIGTYTLELHSDAYNIDRQGLHSEHNLNLSMLNRDLKVLLEIIDRLENATRRYRLH
jgi:hypothetical protein